ncbi:MAG: hypothetical protein QOI63_1788 [Thermoplasmata archaeon]|nr:hypothetical protein [Thermoplasmata archaeon]
MRALALAVLLLLAAAGCSGKGADPTTGATTAPPQAASSSQTMLPPAAPPPAGPRVTITGCTNFGGVFPVPMAAAQALLPDGFKAVPAAGDLTGGATLYVLALSCDGASVDGADVGAALLAYEELAVVPDAAHQVAGVSDYTVPLLFSASPRALGDAFEALGLGKAGGVSWVTTGAGTTTAGGSVGGDGFTLTGQAAPSPPVAIPSGAFVLFGVQGKQVRGVVDGASEGGRFVQAAIVLQAQGNPPLLDQAQPAAQGFSVAGFTLHYAPRGP